MSMDSSSPSPEAVTVTLLPRTIFFTPPESMASASGSSTLRCITRLSGRAPSAGSYPRRQRNSVALSSNTSENPRSPAAQRADSSSSMVRHIFCTSSGLRRLNTTISSILLSSSGLNVSSSARVTRCFSSLPEAEVPALAQVPAPAAALPAVAPAETPEAPRLRAEMTSWRSFHKSSCSGVQSICCLNLKISFGYKKFHEDIT